MFPKRYKREAEVDVEDTVGDGNVCQRGKNPAKDGILTKKTNSLIRHIYSLLS